MCAATPGAVAALRQAGLRHAREVVAPGSPHVLHLSVLVGGQIFALVMAGI